MTKKKPVFFEDTSVAFSSKSNYRLFKMYLLFAAMNYNKLVKIGNNLISFLFKIKFPIKGIIKFTVFEHFCGGETVAESEPTINELAAFNIGTILDYSVEGEKSESGFEISAQEILNTVNMSKNNDHIPFSVFKLSGIASTDLLAKIQNDEIKLSISEEKEYEKVIARVDRICKTAYEYNTRRLIDAEETWIQNAIDDISYEMMRRYNKEQVIVYNTYQMYRKDMLDNLKKAYQLMRSQQVKLGAKLVRGAYMEKERDKAASIGYESPIQPNKAATDSDFNEAIAFCIEHFENIGLCSGTHNEFSNEYLASLMLKNNIEASHNSIFFAQLYGMSDNISFNLAKSGYNVVKYVPYGPVKSVLPYLFRRSQENSSVAGQSSREFKYIKKELLRRMNLA